jgi:parallel beta-helix repeat protein
MKRLAISFSLLLLILLVVSIATVQPITVKANSPKTITVPDQYQTIQSAIGNASSGDTIFVKKGTYYLSAFTSISKSLSLIGEDAKTTIINGNGHTNQANRGNQVTIQVDAQDVTISDFTITNCNNAIAVSVNYVDQSRCKIYGNIFYDNAHSISIQKSSDFQIRNNYINGSGIGISDGPGTISGNTIINGGILVYGKYVTINSNSIIGGNGIDLQWTGPYNIYQNKISKSKFAAIEFGPGVANTQVHENEIKNNTIGIKLKNFGAVGDGYFGSGNVVYRNNIINNDQNVVIETSEAYWSPTQGYPNGTDIVSWDNGKEGNYWSNYSGQGDFKINEDNIDHHPLTQQVDISGTFTLVLPVAIISIVVIVIVFFLVLFRRRQKISKV